MSGHKVFYRCDECDFDAHITCVELPDGVNLPVDMEGKKSKKLKEGVCPAPALSLGMEFYNPDTGCM